jgi:ABC-type phosphonate transport system ATPase subunit
VPVTSADISTADAGRAGYASREALLSELNRHAEGELYRIELGELQPDPRVALRDTVAAGAAETEAIVRRLGRLDAGAGTPWTRRVLELVQAHPGVRAGDLCTQVGLAREPFKINVRKLKALGLTESLEVGYRLSPRGAALLDDLRGRRSG